MLAKCQALATRDSLAKLIYGRLFKWLVHNINKKLGCDKSAASRLFGVLDIAGFESFEINSLEQLFINLSNEHLQQHFNTHVFKQELDDYQAEGLKDMGGLTFKDNTDVLTLIDSKGGILSMLDEEITVPKAMRMVLHSDLGSVLHHEHNQRHEVVLYHCFSNRCFVGSEVCQA